MGMALWLRDARDAAAASETPSDLPPMVSGCRYRIEVFGEGRAPWRGSSTEAMEDAIRLELAAWDASQEQWFLAVPVDMRVERPELPGL